MGDVIRFGDFTLDSPRFELRSGDEIIAIEPQVFTLILHLASNADRVVGRDELIEVVWEGRIVSDETVGSRINAARRALRDNGRDQAVIRTVPRRGFRFVTPVTVGPLSGVDTTTSQSTSSEAEPAREKPVVAVLPFVNLSGEPDQEYLADGITGDIIASLSRHRWLSVIARNTIFGFKNRTNIIGELNDKLSVDYVVEGSVRSGGNRIRIGTSLIDAASGAHLWGENYDREMEDLFQLQDAITMTVVAQVEPELGLAERHRVEKSPPASLQAWDCYHLGMSHFYRFTAAGNVKAQELLKKATDIDPLFGEAHVGWAYSVILGMVYWNTKPSQKALDAALAAVERALEMDSQNATFYSIKARVALARREYKVAMAACNTAVELNPTYAAAYCAMGDALAYDGNYIESLTWFEKSLELSPNDPQLWAFLSYGAMTLIFKGDYQKAIEWAERAQNIPNCQYWAIAHHAVALALSDKQAEAKRVTAKLLQIQPEFSLQFAQDRLFYIKRQEQLDLYLEGLRKAGVPD
jgi:TolB-like protein/Tfp pilus assembly protein PilF